MCAVARASSRGQLTPLCNLAEDLLTQPTPDLQELSVHGVRIRNAHEKLLSADRAYESQITADDMPRECELMLEYDDRAVTILARIDFKLQILTRERVTPSSIPLSISSNNRHESASIKLKPIELKRFDGSFENWLPFWEQFKNAVHENTELDFISKFNYLSNCLIGKAAECIIGFLPSETCYNDAIKLLKEEFGNNEKIIERYIQKLLNIKTVQSTKDIKGLRKLYNETIATMRSLSALKIEASRYEIMINSILLQSLPGNMRLEFYKTKKRVNLNATSSSSTNSVDESEINSLLKFLRLEVEALEISSLSDNQVKREYVSKNKYTASGSAVALYSSNKDDIITCIFCKSVNHKTHMCTSNMSVEEKKGILKKEGRCYRCTNKNHMSKFCKAQWVKCAKCRGRHLTALCENKNNIESRMIDNNTTLSAVDLEHKGTYLQTFKALLCGDENRVLSRCVMDSGSQRTYICEQVVKKLELPTIRFHKSGIITFGQGNKNKKFTNLKRVQVKLKSQYSNEIVNIVATVVPYICADILPVPIIKNKDYEYISERLADNITCDENLVEGVNLLIGQDYLWLFNGNKNKFIGENLVATETMFGWTIQGCYKPTGNESCVFSVFEPEKFDITSFWNLESIGINVNKNDCDNVVPAINLQNKRFIVTLPWRSLDVPLNTNFEIAKIRLYSLTQKLLKNNRMLEYHEGMLDMIKNYIAQQVPVEAKHGNMYYMPHRPVYWEENITTKMRLVFDASSSKPDCLSLNDHLHAGSNFCADLLTILLNFRCRKVAICGDIENAFLQILVHEKDRDAQRFLWYKRMPTKEDEFPEIIEYRMNRVTFGVTSSPYLLAVTIKKLLSMHEAIHPDVCKILQCSFYVDDLVTSVDTVKEAIELHKLSTKIMNCAGFTLRKWISNHSQLNSIFKPHQEIRNSTHKVLGLFWNTTNDEISINLTETIEYICNLPATKRGVMRSMGKIYDPLGVLGPFTVKIKILLQSIWKRKIEWDQRLPEDLFKTFEDWRKELKFMISISFPRCIINNLNNTRNELHLFADASPKAYGVAAYFREVDDGNKIRVSLICSKNRVSPINNLRQNELTLPKLELTAALIASRLSNFLIKNMNIKFDKIHLWTDSSIALYWITGNKAKKSIQNYVRARVNEINQITNIYDWRHINGTENPADLLTRDIKATKFVNSEIWPSGPNWLSKHECEWPSSKLELCMNITEESTIKDKKLQPILNILNYSSVDRLLKVTAFVFKFISRTQCKNKITKINRNISEIRLTLEDYKSAEMFWIKHEQNIYFENEVTCLTLNKPIPKSSKILSFNPVLMDGVIRLNSRLNNTENITLPVILHKKSVLAKLLILKAHSSLLHGSVSSVLIHLRKKYWIIQGRQLIKTIINKWVICKRLYHSPSASTLLSHRFFTPIVTYSFLHTNTAERMLLFCRFNSQYLLSCCLDFYKATTTLATLTQ